MSQCKHPYLSALWAAVKLVGRALVISREFTNWSNTSSQTLTRRLCLCSSRQSPSSLLLASTALLWSFCSWSFSRANYNTSTSVTSPPSSFTHTQRELLASTALLWSFCSWSFSRANYNNNNNNVGSPAVAFFRRSFAGFAFRIWFVLTSSFAGLFILKLVAVGAAHAQCVPSANVGHSPVYKCTATGA